MIDFNKAIQAFQEYLQNYDVNNGMILLKIKHTYGVISLSEYIAKDLNLSEEDIELAKLIALLHDIGRFKPNRFHGLTGYEISMENNNLELAEICLTHSFVNDKIEDFHFPDNEYKIQDIEKTKDIFKNIKLNDYHYLIRLCDFMSIGDTLNSSTIEDRLLDLIIRYPMSQNEFDNLSKTLNNLKEYFEKKYNFDIYKLLENK